MYCLFLGPDPLRALSTFYMMPARMELEIPLL